MIQLNIYCKYTIIFNTSYRCAMMDAVEAATNRSKEMGEKK